MDQQAAFERALAESGSSGPGIAMLLVSGVFAILVIVSWWKVFTKAGQPGWACIVPIYNLMVLAKIGGKPAWWGIVALLVSIIPFAGGIVALIFIVLICLGVSNNFGKGAGFGIGLALLPFIFYSILAFSDARYTRAVA